MANVMDGFYQDPMAAFKPINDPTISSGIAPYMQFGFSSPATNPDVVTGSLVNSGGPSLYEKVVGYRDLDTGNQVNGMGGLALNSLMGLGNLYMGMQQYGLAKDQLQFSKDAFNKNYAAQAKMTNASLMDRQRARVAANSGAYQSVGDYMAQNRIA